MTEKKNIYIAVITGLIVGFVLGVAFCSGTNFSRMDSGDATANVARITRTGQFRTKTTVQDMPAIKDTARCEAIDKDGKRIEILIIK